MDLISDVEYDPRSATIMSVISEALAGSPLGLPAVFDPLNTTWPGLNVLAPLRAFPLNWRVPEREAIVTELPATPPEFVRRLGTART